MNQYSDDLNHSQYRVPAVRHLAWMCQAPQLMSPSHRFILAPHLPADLATRLSAWDADPEKGPDLLTETPPRRLGQYFESLYECLLKDLLGWEILLRNQAVRADGLTLGELDFIVRNPANQQVEHHEVAVKFYLGFAGAEQTPPLWYGPNARDRLDLKSAKLTEQQSRLTEKPQTRALLHSMAIPTPSRSRIFMPGYLFYPAGQALPPPATMPAEHLRGEWLYISELDRMTASASLPDALRGQWAPLMKPHWLGLWQQDIEPEQQSVENALEMVRSKAIPRLFAVLEPVSGEHVWRETCRFFVVPDSWPID
ncbi:DUF1853 family protein [Marinobacter confluentis]|uniref:DUF1853 family protein n=1 Tax=Marinobacter confluentis TaxID=1697557 RepID=A0A4Z1BJ95_9GAMM|nr:DUF1853 family protein [Marinobacter confluentis]TGN39837.1 DUF1853 family protein [Marinobacter confluentis]